MVIPTDQRALPDCPAPNGTYGTTKANQTVWKLNDFDEFAGKGAEKNWIGPVSRYVNTLGEVPSLFRKKETSRASLPRVISKTARETLDMSSANFSKSSMFSFFVAELVLHAMNQINSVSYRNEKGSPDVPRKLGRIILTLPTASLLLEKQIMEHRCKSGVQLLWDVANWHPFIEEYKHLEQPETIVQFDEASCSQVLYLYAEINRKYRRSIDDYFSTFGKKRPRPGESMDQSDSFRMASLDIGGGTIDLMIMTYYSS
ncbi:MAG: hypothetical protein GKR95_08400 [Gammaproteobacteria bacterium]|nr:hypothetical protein [Gammaproteobacteria bacterium]